MKRNVVLWGSGTVAREMYRKYKDEISVRYIISNNPKEKEFVPENGVSFEVRRPESKGKGLNEIIVICSKAYEAIAEQMIYLGYRPFVDFLDFEMASALLSGKKILLLYGICHLRAVGEYLKTSETLSEQYIVFYISNYKRMNSYEESRLLYLVKNCSVFIYNLEITPEKFIRNTSLLAGLSGRVHKICIPKISFGGYFPQKQRRYNELNPYAVKCENQDYTPFSYGDEWINGCILGGMMLDDIAERWNEDLYDKDFILKYCDQEWKAMKYQERSSDLKVSGYIKDHFREKRLFRNEAHMENSLIYYYVSEILKILNFENDIILISDPLLKCSEHPILPCVARALELEWSVTEEYLDLYTYGGWRKVGVPEFLSDYYEVCKDIKKLKEGYFLPE